MPSKAKTLTARQSFPAEIDGRTVVVIQGARLPAAHPVVKANPGMFEEIVTVVLQPAEPSSVKVKYIQLKSGPLVELRNGMQFPASHPLVRGFPEYFGGAS
jgi:hypothetical protein